MALFTESSLWNVLLFWLHVHVLIPVWLVMIPEMVSVTLSRPIQNRFSRAIDWDTCEFGDTYQPYDEECDNGAKQIPPCNPGQLKVTECIGQDGDTSRMCDPCPQKYYQSYYNRCTRCRECSECGANEYIKEPCNDESDTVCESIIPPEPMPTTTPRQTTTRVTTQGSTQLSTYRSVTTTELSSLGTNRTHAVTYRNIGTTEISTFLTTLAEREEPKATYRGINTLALTVATVIIIIILFVLVLILLTINWMQRKEIKDLKTRINNCDGTEMVKRSSDSKNTRNDRTTSENVCEGSSEMQDTDSNDAETTILTVQVNDRNESEVNQHSEELGLQGSVGGDSEKSESDSEASLEAGSSPDFHKVWDGGGDTASRKAHNRTPDPTDMDTDVEDLSALPREADVHRAAASGTVPSSNYENLPEDRSHQRDRNAPSTSHASGGSGMEDFSGSRVTGSERTSEGARSDLPTTSRKGELGETNPLMQPQTLPEMGSHGTKEQKRKGFDSQRFWRTFYSRNKKV